MNTSTNINSSSRNKGRIGREECQHTHSSRSNSMSMCSNRSKSMRRSRRVKEWKSGRGEEGKRMEEGKSGRVPEIICILIIMTHCTSFVFFYHTCRNMLISDYTYVAMLTYVHSYCCLQDIGARPSLRGIRLGTVADVTFVITQ